MLQLAFCMFLLTDATALGVTNQIRLRSPSRASRRSLGLSSLKSKDDFGTTTKSKRESAQGILDTVKANSKEFLIGGLGIGLAGLELAINQPASNAFFNPVIEACSASSPSIHPYVGQLGGIFVCVVTQLMFSLTQNLPAGFIAWMTTIISAMPAIFMIGVEGGRRGAKPILNAPFFFMLLSQVFGVSVVMTGVWLPIYLWGRSKEQDDRGYAVPVALGRLVTNVLFVQVPTFVLSLLCFQLDPNQNSLWTVVAGILAGPIVALLAVPQGFFPPPEVSTTDVNESSLTPESKTLVVLASLSFLTWLAIVGVGWGAYGTDMPKLLNELWFQAPPAVQFMTADAVFVYGGVLLALAASSVPLAFSCLVATPLLGPGAAPMLAMVVNRQQQAKRSSVTDADR